MTATFNSNPAEQSLVFRRRGPDGEQFLIDGLGFVSSSLERASRFPIRPDGTSFLWSRFTGPIDRVDALISLEILELDPETAAICWGPHQWDFPRDPSGSLNLRRITLAVIQHLLVPGGPFAAIRVLWRDTGEHVQNFGITCMVRGVREPEIGT